MQEKLLKKIISDYSGQDSEKLVDILYDKQNVNEFLIAKKLNLTINQTRNMLYKLADTGLVQFIRKKDKKKGGWYTYFWTLKVKRSLLKYKEKILGEIAGLEGQLKSLETERHFYCENCDIEYNEESALLNDYTCPECGEILKMKDPANFTGHIKREIKNLNDTLAQVDEEIGQIEVKELKSKGRRLKAEQKKKDEEKKKRKLEREKEKKKALRDMKKKPAKKSSKKADKKHAKKNSFLKSIKKFSKKK
jgi:transcription factor E